MPLTEEQIARLEALEQRASEAPWAPVHDALDESVESTTLGRFVCHLNTNMLRYHEDAELIAESRNALPDLIAALRASQAEARRYREVLESLEWKPQRNAAGGITDFCPWCGGCIGAYRINERIQPGRHAFRPDGHKADCRLVLALDQARAALAATVPAPAREGA